MDEYMKASRALWDEWAGINYRSDFYKVDAFKAGLNKLRRYEMDELGDVEGKELLHLQCHFGMEHSAGRGWELASPAPSPGPKVAPLTPRA